MHHTIAQIIHLYTTTVASDLGTDTSVIGLSLGFWYFVACFGGLTGGAYSTFSGRRPVFLVGVSLMCLGSVGAGLSKSVPMYMVSRAMEAFGASSGVYVGSAVVGDIYQLEQRGNALGVLRSATYIGVILALPMGGLVIAQASWRTLQFCLGVMGCLIFIFMFFYFPETSHPGTRGIEQILRSSRKNLVVNPFKPLALLRSPNILAISFTTFTAFLAGSVLIVPLGQTLKSKFGIDNATITSVCFVLMAIGNMFGAYLSGKISDRAITHRSGVWCPEDRLRTAFPATLAGMPFVVLAFGLVAEYLPMSHIGLSLCLVCLFVDGVVTEFVLCPSIAYLVDLMHDRSADAIAASTSLAVLLLSISEACILPSVEKLGIAGTNTLVAILIWSAHVVLWYTVKYGDQKKKDVEYSILE